MSKSSDAYITLEAQGQEDAFVEWLASERDAHDASLEVHAPTIEEREGPKQRDLGTCAACGDLLVDDGGPIHFAGEPWYCSHACRKTCPHLHVTYCLICVDCGVGYMGATE